MATDLSGARLRSGKPSGTAGVTALLRAVDAARAPGRRLTDDRYAHLFASRSPRFKYYAKSPGTAALALTAFDRMFGGFVAEILLRVNHFDAELAAAAERGVDQVLLVGAGYECTAQRHPELDGVRFYEVDHPATQTAKLRVLGAAGIPTDGVSYLPVDLETQSLSAALEDTGFDPGRPCLIGWHGVSFFLRPAAFRAALAGMAVVSAPGSRLVFDYMDAAVVDGTTPYASAKRVARAVGKRGEPYANGQTARTALDAAHGAGFGRVEALRIPDLVDRFAPAGSRIRRDDFMGVVTVDRV
jgi:methyltransferase (TIGR00027 family)